MRFARSSSPPTSHQSLSQPKRFNTTLFLEAVVHTHHGKTRISATESTCSSQASVKSLCSQLFGDFHLLWARWDLEEATRETPKLTPNAGSTVLCGNKEQRNKAHSWRQSTCWLKRGKKSPRISFPGLAGHCLSLNHVFSPRFWNGGSSSFYPFNLVPYPEKERPDRAQLYLFFSKKAET